MTITHPYHPRHGQQVRVIRIHRRGADPDLDVQLPDGLRVIVAMSWTDYATPGDFNPPPTPPHLLDLDGLRQTVQLIDRMRQEGRYPATDSGGKACISGDKSYD